MISDSISHTLTHTHIPTHRVIVHHGHPLCIARWRLALDLGWAWTALVWTTHLDNVRTGRICW